MYDIVVVGGGPAGLTAALYGLRNGKSVAIIEKSVFGGQITNSPKVENIPGFAEISGDEFAGLYLDQVMGQGGKPIFDAVTGIEVVEPGEGAEASEVASSSAGAEAGANSYVKVLTESGDTIEGKTVILATGTKHRVLGFEGEDELIGNGVHFCAVCDGDFYRDKTVVIIGGGNSALVEANLLVDIVGKLIILQDMPYFTADAKLQEQLFSHEEVEKHVSTKILGYEIEDGRLIGIRYSEPAEAGTDEPRVEKVATCDGVFLAIGLIPDNRPFEDFAELNKWGYFETDEYCHTKTPQVFVAGDCRSKTLRQVTTACADGAQAAIEACGYLRNN